MPLAISEFSTVEKREMRGLISEFKLDMKLEIISQIWSGCEFWFLVNSAYDLFVVWWGLEIGPLTGGTLGSIENVSWLWIL